jgi:hypothetical protein
MKRLVMLVVIVLVPVSGHCLTDRQAFDLLVEKSKQVEVFPLHVYTTPGASEAVADGGPFRGKALPVTSYGFFASAYPDVKETQQPGEILATYQFSQGTRWRCFLLRVPSMHAVDAIDLWVFDAVGGKWQKPLRIADSWGDAGEVFDIQSWIGDINHDGRPDIVRKTLRTYQDPGEPDSKAIIVERKSSIFIWDKDRFKDDSRRYRRRVDLKRYKLVNKDIQ